MKLTTKGLLGLGLLATISLAACSNSSTTTKDTSSLDTNIAASWFSLGQTGEGKFDNAYQTQIYDPLKVEENKPTSYYTVYAPTDIDSSIRLTLTPITEDAFKEGSTSEIKSLQTIAYTTSYQSGIIDQVKEKKESIDSSITSLTGSVQTSWKATLGTYSLTSSNLTSNTTNYLCVYYLPLYVRTYSNSTIDSAGFVAIPVYANITTGSITSDADGKDVVSVTDTTAKSFVDSSKYVTFNYDSSSDKIS